MCTDQFLPLFSQKCGFPELLADPEPLQLQIDAAVVGGDCSLGDAQLLLEDCSAGRLATLSRIAALLLLLTSKRRCTQLILERERR